jgi:hypothetical protein
VPANHATPLVPPAKMLQLVSPAHLNHSLITTVFAYKNVPLDTTATLTLKAAHHAMELAPHAQDPLKMPVSAV